VAGPAVVDGVGRAAVALGRRGRRDPGRGETPTRRAAPCFRRLGGLIAQHQGNVSAAARTARMDRNHLRELLRRHDIDPKR